MVLTGRRLLELGLVGSHSGNLSVRNASRIVITKHDAMLGWLEESDLVRVPATQAQDHGRSGSASRPLPRSLPCHPGRATLRGTWPSWAEVRVGAALAARRPPAPSMDLEIHRAIYAATDARTIVHAHPVHAVALSLGRKEIVPVDVEGICHLKTVPVVGSNTIKSYREMGRLLPLALKASGIALMRGHGSYAIGATLEEALHLTSALEFSAAVLACSHG